MRGSRLVDAVDGKLDLFRVEADEPGDLLALGQRRSVRPGDILEAAASQRPVLRCALVGTVADGVARDEEVHAHVSLRQVVTRGTARLEEEGRLVRLRERHA